MKAIHKIIKIIGYPAMTHIAKHFGITHTAVWIWVDQGYAPAARAIHLSKLVGGKVKIEELLADVPPKLGNHKPKKVKK